MSRCPLSTTGDTPLRKQACWYLAGSRDVYRYLNFIQYVSSIHCFDTRCVSSILICSKYQDKQVPVLMTGPPKPHFNMCTTSQDSGLVQNSTQRVTLDLNGWSFLEKKH